MQLYRIQDMFKSFARDVHMISK